MEIISNIAMISINETLIAQVLAFLIFMYVINRLMFKPLQCVMTEREDYIDKIQKDIAEAEKELENVQMLLKENETAVKKEAFSIKNEMQESGDQQASEIFNRSKNEIQVMRENAKKEVSAKLEEARQMLQKEADTLVVQILEKVLERRLAK